MASKLRKEDINTLCVCYRMSLDFDKTGIPYVNAMNEPEVTTIIEKNKQYKIILVGKVEDIQRLIASISSYNIHSIHALDDGTKLNVDNKKAISVHTNERDLILDVICSIVRHAHDEQIFQIERGNNRVANERIYDVLRLLDDIETFYFDQP